MEINAHMSDQNTLHALQALFQTRSGRITPDPSCLDISGSELGPDTDYPDRGSSWFFSVPLGKYQDSNSKTRQRLFPSISLQIHYYLFYHLML
jgi:hypothetical protein